MSAIAIQPIDVVSNGVIEAVDEGWAQVESQIVLRPELAGIVDGAGVGGAVDGGVWRFGLRYGKGSTVVS